MSPSILPLFFAAIVGVHSVSRVSVNTIMNLDIGPVGSGPAPCSASLSAHAGDANPTAVVAQYLNDPIGVRAFNSSSGANSPIWELWPETVDMDTTWQSVGSLAPVPLGNVDTVLMQYSNQLFSSASAPCIFWGMSTAGPGASATPLWTHSEPDCTPGTSSHTADYGANLDLTMTRDGRTTVAVIFVDNTVTLIGLDTASGDVLYRIPISGGTYGVATSGNSQYVLSSSDSVSGGRKALVFDSRTGTQRGAKGCESPWDIPPAISFDGAFVLTGDQNGLWLCTWDSSANAYSSPFTIDIPALGQTYWFPLQTAILNTTVGGVMKNYGGATFFDGDYREGRFYAVDLDAVVAGSLSYIVIDHIQDITTSVVSFALVETAGPYFVTGSNGGNGNGTQPNLFLYEAGTPDAPAMTSLWNATTAGLVNNLATLVTSTSATGIDIHVLVASFGETASGSSGNGGNALWLELNVAVK
jgi:hypothetical protein